MKIRLGSVVTRVAIATLATAMAASARADTPTTQPGAAPLTTSEADTLSDVIQLTHGFDRAGEAYFSPQMDWIIFQAAPAGQPHYQMYLAPLKHDAGGVITGAGDPVQISPAASRNTCGFFSPDGRSLIFASTAGKEDPNEPAAGYQRQGRSYRWEFPAGMEIYQVDNWRRKIADLGEAKAANFAVRALTDNNFYDAEGAYSSDGKWICFTSMRSGGGDVYVMKSDGSNPVRITDAPGYDGGPFFCPDGKRLVYRSDRHHNDLLQVFVADLAFDAAGNITGLKEEHQLTNDENVNWGPYWHPDARHIIYATSRHGHTNYELYAMRDDGSHQARITYTDGADILPVFSADGKYLMWTSKRSADHTTQIFLGHFRPPPGW